MIKSRNQGQVRYEREHKQVLTFIAGTHQQKNNNKSAVLDTKYIPLWFKHAWLMINQSTMKLVARWHWYWIDTWKTITLTLDHTLLTSRKTLRLSYKQALRGEIVYVYVLHILLFYVTFVLQFAYRVSYGCELFYSF